MGKSHPIALQEHVIAFVEEGQTHCEAARHFRVSPCFVNNMVILKCEAGSLLLRIMAGLPNNLHRTAS